MKRLENKVAIITGAASGFGAADARLFAKEGAKVVLTDIDEENLNQVTDGITQENGEAMCVILDVTSPDDWQKVVNKTTAEFGGIDILVNNAGIASQAPFLESNYETYKKIIDVNLNSHYLGIMAVAPSMIERKGGSIINMSSTVGMVALPGGDPGYTTSKGGSRALTKQAAAELIGFNIRVNSIHPGLFKTAMTKNQGLLDNPEIYSQLTQAIPIKRFGEPEEIANVALFLASDESSYMVGSELVVDGGLIVI
ncbi:SDR family NAD(P)-dependent oxidoreductase [Rhodohalobacter sp. 614A]|uniref:SDR family NAD(P)-dependent oxidoreductase n=1 Tax=Rhodohalobacter sp. 614A TaxID=2908649 RepID=UPI001F396B2A|nr:SDR family oxidoreductase [Rhodohalobacter sp. 614A]